MKPSLPSDASGSSTAEAQLEADSPREECVIKLSGDWSLGEAVPSWEEVVGHKKGTKVRIIADHLGTWDTSLLLFLRHGRAWCLAKKKDFDTSSLPRNLQVILKHAEAGALFKPAPKETPVSFRFFLGRETIKLINYGEEWAIFVGNCTLGIIRLLRGRGKFRWLDSFLEMQHCWNSSLPIVGFISFLVGVILAFQSAVQLKQYGVAILVVDLVSLSVVREMGPMMAAIVVAGGTGAGIAAQLGNMRVDEEIDALETLGISAVDFLVLPRLLAVTIMMPILALYANIFGILGGVYICATMLSIPASAYWVEMHNRLNFCDIFGGVIKSFAFGILIALAGCLRGIHCERNTAGVGTATSSAVVTSILLIILTDAVFAVIFNSLGI
ncbi:MAG: hypothetical protein A3F67_04615 [Verrucomicrobia bacterium RIFCSPHIGHO2_12_FULL_41_10]|nr:MAG: hypothetical protein A3F67_04615 [Verrucomicrobia bacterium RIFCSPHIGHO2_12_FULL_41_10]HLB33772.1 ABC transporter permease [Chthoniobacterales bacterium]